MSKRSAVLKSQERKLQLACGAVEGAVVSVRLKEGIKDHENAHESKITRAPSTYRHVQNDVRAVLGQYLYC